MTEETHPRPSWDEYFMDIARTVAKRATCDRGRSGCVIARDKQILVTGYVGAPKGLPHCDEVGHQMKTVTHEDGHNSQHCMRTAHAEQNAIVQAARLGIGIDGGTLYYKNDPLRRLRQNDYQRRHQTGGGRKNVITPAPKAKNF